jgi:methylenetetrahydrofolate dehydrogenase (NADP+)/methenyltetrahydrofolate cyclohydrolase
MLKAILNFSSYGISGVIGLSAVKNGCKISLIYNIIIKIVAEAKIISGNLIRNQIVEELKERINCLKNNGIIPTLAIIQIGNNEASNAYIRNKIRLSEKLNTITLLKKYEETITENELIKVIQDLNNDDKINGIILQLPIPKHINEEKIINLISPNKDVDCFHTVNVGKL